MLEYHEQDNIYVNHIRCSLEVHDALAWMKQYREEIEKHYWEKLLEEAEHHFDLRKVGIGLENTDNGILYNEVRAFDMGYRCWLMAHHQIDPPVQSKSESRRITLQKE